MSLPGLTRQPSLDRTTLDSNEMRGSSPRMTSEGVRGLAMTILQRVSLPGRIDSTALYDWDELVQEDRVHRLIYTDPAIFAAEMTNIFGAVWIYLGHESQIPANDDYITVRLGLRPIILLRDSQGKIRALFNRCAHRGTTLCR